MAPLSGSKTMLAQFAARLSVESSKPARTRHDPIRIEDASPCFGSLEGSHLSGIIVKYWKHCVSIQ
jgi:hypothetical protein